MSYKYFNHMNVMANVKHSDISDINSEVNTALTSSCLSDVNFFGNTANLPVKVQIVKLTNPHYILKDGYDTYLRDTTPTFSYYEQQSLYTGESSKGSQYESFIKFNIKSIPRKVRRTLVSAKLVFKKFYGNENYNIDLYTVDNKWYDNNISWLVKPGTKESLGKFKNENGNLVIDVTKYIKDAYDEKIVDNGFKLCNEIKDVVCQLYSLDSSDVNKPYVDIEYIDPNILAKTSNKCAEISITNSSVADAVVDLKELHPSVDCEICISKPYASAEIDLIRVNDAYAEVIYANPPVDSYADCELFLVNPQQRAEVKYGFISSVDAELILRPLNSSDTYCEINMFKPPYIKGELICGYDSKVECEINTLSKSDVDCIIDYMPRTFVEDRTCEIIYGQESSVDSEIHYINSSTCGSEITLQPSCNKEGEIDVLIAKDSYVKCEMALRSLSCTECELDLFKGAQSFAHCEMSLINSSSVECELDLSERWFSEQVGEIYFGSFDDKYSEMTLLCQASIPCEVDILHSDDVDSEVQISFAKTCQSAIDVNYTSILNGEIQSVLQSHKDSEMGLLYQTSAPCEMVFEGTHTEVNGEVQIGFMNECNSNIDICLTSSVECEIQSVLQSQKDSEMGLLYQTSALCELILASMSTVDSEVKLGIASNCGSIIDTRSTSSVNGEVQILQQSHRDSEVSIYHVSYFNGIIPYARKNDMLSEVKMALTTSKDSEIQYKDASYKGAEIGFDFSKLSVKTGEVDIRLYSIRNSEIDLINSSLADCEIDIDIESSLNKTHIQIL